MNALLAVIIACGMSHSTRARTCKKQVLKCINKTSRVMGADFASRFCAEKYLK